MKQILMIGTGGTIASKAMVGGFSPQLSAEEMLNFIPEIRRICWVDSVQICNLDSTNVFPEHWLLMARTIRENYEKYDGFVLCHGTDTMAYTAAALSYLIPDSPKPIVITGAQKPISMEITDSKTNLYDSFLYACSETCGVQIVFGGKVIAGTRARKTRTKSFNAFSSINYPPLAMIQDGRLMQYISLPRAATPVFYNRLNPKVALLKLIPGTDSDVLGFLLERNDAVIVESFGVGGLPSLEKCHFYEEITRWTKQGRTVVMTTQVPNEGSDMAIYQVGQGLKERVNVLEAYDMTTEAAVAKLMWILGMTNETDTIRRLFYTTVSNDILYHETV